MLFGIELWVFGVLSALVGLVGYAPYVRDTWRGETRPERCSWLIWSVLGTIAFFSQVHEGATQSLWFAGTQVSATIFVFLLSIRNGTGNFLCPTYILSLGTAGLGLVAWYFTDSAVYALMLTIGISLLGGVLTVRKAYRSPGTETATAWGIAWVSTILAMCSVGQMDWVLLAYPLYLFTLYSAILIALYFASHKPVETTAFADLGANVPLNPSVGSAHEI